MKLQPVTKEAAAKGLRIQLASDLHLESLGQFSREELITPHPDADLLVLAGDIAPGVAGIRRFAQWPVPVLYVPGNHEFYGHNWESTRLALRGAALGTSVVVLDGDVADLTNFGQWSASRRDKLKRVRFLGATLWTDYRLVPGFTQRQLMHAAEMAISDHFRIQTDGGPFRAAQALADHEAARAWLRAKLSGPFEGKTVVVTHHAPHPMSIHPKWLGPSTLALNAAFASDLSELIQAGDLWLHGHVHDSFDYELAGCRVVANPRGYARGGASANDGRDSQFENAKFVPDLLIDIGA